MDANVCPSCERRVALDRMICSRCGHQVVESAQGAISFWSVGKGDMAFVGELAKQIERSLGCPVVVQPGWIDPRPSERNHWNGRSGNVILNQVLRRRQDGSLTALAICEDNIVSGSTDNFLFGYAYLGLPAACVSLHVVRSDSPDPKTLLHRAKSNALHELGHNFGLDEHTYSEGKDCCMLGEVALDSLDLIDSHSADYCDGCLAVAGDAMREFAGRISPHLFAPRRGATFAGRFVLGGPLGGGGLGQVWRAQDIQLGQPVALKFVVDRHFRGGPQVDLNAEAASARRLSHPHIIPVFDFVRDGATGALVMRLVEGRDAEKIRLSSPRHCLDANQVLPWFGQAVSAIAYAHAQGVVHRDLKPANCLIDARGDLVLADFGLSQFATPTPSLPQTRGAGTPGFSAPEQLAGAPAHPNQDVYALGATFYALLTGQPPRTVRTQSGLRPVQRLVPLDECRRSALGAGAFPLPADFIDVIHRCLAWNPQARPAAADLAARYHNPPPRPKPLGTAPRMAGHLMPSIHTPDRPVTTGGTRGALSDRLNQPFSVGKIPGYYHIFAADLDWSKPVGLLLYADGPGEFGLVNPTSPYLLGGEPDGMIAVAKRHNLLLVTPQAPGGPCADGGGNCWYGISPGTGVTPGQKHAWSWAMVQAEVLAKYDLDLRRVVIAGYSSGAQWAMQYFGPGSAPRFVKEGLVVAISYGGRPRVPRISNAAFRACVPHVWDCGDQDDAWTQSTWSDGVQEGIEWYKHRGYSTYLTLVPGLGHARIAGAFGQILDREITNHLRPA